MIYSALYSHPLEEDWAEDIGFSKRNQSELYLGCVHRVVGCENRSFSLVYIERDESFIL